MSLLAKELKKENAQSKRENQNFQQKLKVENEGLKRENEELKREIRSSQQELKKGNEELKQENRELTQKTLCIHHAVVGEIYPIPPGVGVPANGKKLHFYSDIGGQLMSVCREESGKVVFKVYKGKFQQSNVTKVVVNIDERATETLTSRSRHGYREYPDEARGNVVQKFSFELPRGADINIISVS